MNEKSKRRISLWLYSGCFLIFLMVVIGGITRLTGSGLSITEWNLIMGSIPPLNDEEWQDAFNKYQQIPQFEKINSHFELNDFKSIYWWEFIHRQLGRLIGMVFIIPFLYFLFTKQMDRSMIGKSLFLFFLGGLQGFLGWYMVSSGLVERTSVSHIRLAIHLITAFITFGFTYWFALEIRSADTVNREQTRSGSGLVKIIFSLLFIQIIYGAFVAGMHAGKMYNTFPLMDGQVIPTGMGSAEPFWLNFFNNPVTVQFIHRIFAFLLLFLIAKVWWSSKKMGMDASQRKAMNFVLLAVSVQFLLGVLTLLTKVDITIASLHQIGAFFLFSSVIYLLFTMQKIRRVS
ncbi:MAG TPA: COX15/CtaA family protein [Bacteroidia bacterium]|nr:COX15/CtaA family protein [Bacteroidia bacterium]HNS11771.1 COX15/CtaA family protein [Bacteroidia bacterium]